MKQFYFDCPLFTQSMIKLERRSLWLARPEKDDFLRTKKTGRQDKQVREGESRKKQLVTFSRNERDRKRN